MTSNFVHHFEPWVNSNWSYSLKTTKSAQNRWLLFPCDLEIWQMTLKNNRAPLLIYLKLSAHGEFKLELESFYSQIGSKSTNFFVPCDHEIWWMTLKNNRTPLLCYFKLCTSFRKHLWIQTGVMVQKSSNWGKICFDLCDLHLWPLTLTFCMDIIFVHGNKFSWWYNEGTLWKMCIRWMDGRTEIFLELLGCS